MLKTPHRIYQITELWKEDNKTMQREYIIAGQSKEEIETYLQTIKHDSSKVHIKDMGIPEKLHCFYTGPVTPAGFLTPTDLPDDNRLCLQFAAMIGSICTYNKDFRPDIPQLSVTVTRAYLAQKDLSKHDFLMTYMKGHYSNLDLSFRHKPDKEMPAPTATTVITADNTEVLNAVKHYTEIMKSEIEKANQQTSKLLSKKETPTPTPVAKPDPEFMTFMKDFSQKLDQVLESAKNAQQPTATPPNTVPVTVTKDPEPVTDDTTSAETSKPTESTVKMQAPEETAAQIDSTVTEEPETKTEKIKIYVDDLKSEELYAFIQSHDLIVSNKTPQDVGNAFNALRHKEAENYTLTDKKIILKYLATTETNGIVKAKEPSLNVFIKKYISNEDPDRYDFVQK